MHITRASKHFLHSERQFFLSYVILFISVGYLQQHLLQNYCNTSDHLACLLSPEELQKIKKMEKPQWRLRGGFQGRLGRKQGFVLTGQECDRPTPELHQGRNPICLIYSRALRTWGNGWENA